jgi:hypothetical protein
VATLAAGGGEQLGAARHDRGVVGSHVRSRVRSHARGGDGRRGGVADLERAQPEPAGEGIQLGGRGGRSALGECMRPDPPAGGHRQVGEGDA